MTDSVPIAAVPQLGASPLAPHTPKRLVEYPQFALPPDPVPGAVCGEQGQVVLADRQEPPVPGGARQLRAVQGC